MQTKDSNALILNPARKSYHWLQVHEKQAIISDFSLGMSQKDIAAKYAISRDTVRRIMKEFRESCPQAEISKDLGQYRDKLKGKAITAVESGLDDPSDNYKRANIGVQVLRGIGEFNGDAPRNDISLLIANMPPELYGSAIAAGAIEIIPDEPDEKVTDVGPEQPSSRD